MLFSDRQPTLYRNSPLHEVICQLRFPTILTINNAEPAAFQDSIRAEFPQYVRRQDTAAPQISGLGSPTPQVKQLPPVTNYHFVSADGLWKLNLTQNFIALSTLHYSGWKEFARQLDRPLAAFIQAYQPAYFERVGLRYVNFISRKKLGLEGTPFSQLISPAYTGPLQQEDVQEENMLNCACDLLMKLDSSCQAKIHAGPGRVKTNAQNAPEDTEVKYIFDLDLSMGGQVPCTLSAGALETLHIHADRLFEGALTDQLRNAMDPVCL